MTIHDSTNPSAPAHGPVSTGHISSVHLEDLLPVQSRISWAAILAGSILALALYFLLTLLGGALGLSIHGHTSDRTLGNAAAAWSIVTTAVCLFAGGYVASQVSVGENKHEGALYGLLVWALVFGILLWLMASGVKAGFSAMMGIATTGVSAANATAQNTTQGDWEEAAKRAGIPAERINELKEKAKNAPADAKAAADDPATKQKAETAAREAESAATKVAWWAVAGTLLSMAAAVGGGFVGAGRAFGLMALHVRRPVRRQV